MNIVDMPKGGVRDADDEVCGVPDLDLAAMRALGLNIVGLSGRIAHNDPGGIVPALPHQSGPTRIAICEPTID
jgi:hypothetical protein